MQIILARLILLLTVAASAAACAPPGAPPETDFVKTGGVRTGSYVSPLDTFPGPIQDHQDHLYQQDVLDPDIHPG
ncbi:MAG TPA: hypothetical protein VGN83_21400 [Falsiroseomonas sp.]|jgi:hypothetical protein|nr:hypothetical protein [Falsiroseomonas sp.]